MRLDQLSANIRLRSPWEAVDLGFSMVQHWWKSIYPPLIFFNLLYLLPLFFFLSSDLYVFILLFFWWIKPYSHRLILHIISQKLFNNNVDSALANLKSLQGITPGGLTIRRFSFSRGFNLPIWQLEKLRGQERAKRQQVLLSAVHTEAIWLTVGLFMIESILIASFYGLILMMIPESHLDGVMDSLFSGQYNEAFNLPIILFSIVFISVTLLIEPFYIASNFALYINRRTQLEAWDIELAFRKMAQRLTDESKELLSIFVIFFAIGLSGFNQPAYAAEPTTEKNLPETSEVDYLNETRLLASESKRIIDEIIHTKDLIGKKITRSWKLKPEEKQSDDENPDWFNLLMKIIEPLSVMLASLIEYALWILLAVAAVTLYLTRARWLYLFSSDDDDEDDYQAPEVMFGMDIREESLPDDIVAESRRLWQSQQARTALSLLYRGALSQLIHNEKIELKSSYTEGDILQIARQFITENKSHYLSELTAAWKLVAYAHRDPQQQTMDWLFEHWQHDFASTASINERKP